MLDLLCRELNLLFTAAVDDSIFKEIYETITWEKTSEKRLFLLGCYSDEIITLKHHFYMEKGFWIILHQKLLC